MTKCQITCKSLQKSSKCQNFLRVWHLVIFREDQLKKPPCISELLHSQCGAVDKRFFQKFICKEAVESGKVIYSSLHSPDR